MLLSIKQISSKDNLSIIYLDQFASSGIFESNTSEWIKIRQLVSEGYNRKQFICPLSIEHYIETSQKHRSKAIHLDKEFYKISGGFAFKSELFITSQLISSLLRKNNYTLKTFMYDKIYKNVLSENNNFDLFDLNKKTLNTQIEEGTRFANEIRKNARNVKAGLDTKKKFIEAHISISVSQFIARLEELLINGQIVIRGVHFSSGDVPNWIDLIIHQLTEKHRLKKKEIKQLINELNHNGFKNIPTLDIRTSLSAIISVMNKKETVNDQLDIMRISSGLPISDFLLTDSARKSEIEELSLDKKYQTKVFSGRKGDLDNLINELEVLLRRNSEHK